MMNTSDESNVQGRVRIGIELTKEETQSDDDTFSTALDNVKEEMDIGEVVLQGSYISAMPRVSHSEDNGSMKYMLIKEETCSDDDTILDAVKQEMDIGPSVLQRSNPSDISHAHMTGCYVRLTRMPSVASLVNKIKHLNKSKDFSSKDVKKSFVKKSGKEFYLSNHDRICFDKKLYKPSQKSDLQRPVLRHTRERRYKCGFCDHAALLKSHLQLHMYTHTGERPYKCHLCDYAASQRSVLKRHVLRHSGEKPYKCDLCDYTTSNKSNLQAHNLVHTGEKPYKCKLCDYAASRKSYLQTHILRHTGEKRYKCDLCDFTTSRKYTLQSHIFNHTGEKRFKCDICGYAASWKNLLYRHILRRHKCDLRDYTTTMKSSSHSHIQIPTGDKPHKCDYCDYAATKKLTLQRHVLKHSGEKPNKCIIRKESFTETHSKTHW